MRDETETQMAASDPVDRLLDDAGSRWRAEQPEPRRVDASLFSSDRAPRFAGAWTGHAWSFFAGAASTAAILIVVALAAPNLIPRLGGGTLATPDPATGYLPTGLANCPLTKPDPSFTPPGQPGADYDPPDGSAWYGSKNLWTLMDIDGEVWTALPASKLGLTQKTFWWREGYNVQREPRPEIFVTGERLDGPGRFGFGPGTNAFWGLGSAMLVGIEIPEPGCWEVTARYYAESLSYVVWVGEE